MAISVGNVFMAAIVPGLTLSAFYLIYVATLAAVKPSLAPPLPANLLNIPKGEIAPLVIKSFVPPVFLISLIKGSILLVLLRHQKLGRSALLEQRFLQPSINGLTGTLLFLSVILQKRYL